MTKIRHGGVSYTTLNDLYLRLDGTNVPTANYNWTTSLTTTGNLQGTNVTGTNSVVAGTMTLTSGSITDTTGAISFGNENLTTTGDIRLVSDTNRFEIGGQAGGDIQIYHDGANSYINNSTTGALIFDNNVVTVANATGLLQFYGEYTPTSGTGGTTTANLFDGTCDLSNVTLATTANYIGNNFSADMDGPQTTANFAGIAFTGTQFTNTITGNSTANTNMITTLTGVKYDVDIDGTWTALGMTLAPIYNDIDITASINASHTCSAIFNDVRYNVANTVNTITGMRTYLYVRAITTGAGATNYTSAYAAEIHIEVNSTIQSNAYLYYAYLNSSYEGKFNTALQANIEMIGYGFQAPNWNMANRDTYGFWTDLPNDSRNFSFVSSGADGWMAGDNIKWKFGATATDLTIYSDGTDGIITVASGLRLGDGTANYVDIQPDGEIQLVGTARVKKITSLVLHGVSSGASTNVGNYYGIPSLDDTVDEYSTWKAEKLQLDSDVSVTASLKIYFATANNQVGVTVASFRGSYSTKKEGEDASAATGSFTDVTKTLDNNQPQNLLIEHTLVSNIVIDPDDVFGCAIYRDVDPSDTVVGDIRIFKAWIEYTVNKLGEAT